MRKSQAWGLIFFLCLYFCLCQERSISHKIMAWRASDGFSLESTYLSHGWITKGWDKGETLFIRGEVKQVPLLIFLTWLTVAKAQNHKVSATVTYACFYVSQINSAFHGSIFNVIISSHLNKDSQSSVLFTNSGRQSVGLLTAWFDEMWILFVCLLIWNFMMIQWGKLDFCFQLWNKIVDFVFVLRWELIHHCGIPEITTLGPCFEFLEIIKTSLSLRDQWCNGT